MLLIVFGCSNESNQPTAPAINQGPSNTGFEAVALPSMPDKGKLTIKLSAQGGQNVDTYFQIDNIRVK